MTLGENISISQTGRAVDASILDEVCSQSGISLDFPGLGEGYDTLLRKEFGGTDLSGGQWQRVAIARGYFREHQLIALDEPTAAIDPYKESILFCSFARISGKKTTLIVTHRMGSVKMADRIIVIKAGRIVEQGTFDELMACNAGEFKRLYGLQPQWYRECF